MSTARPRDNLKTILMLNVERQEKSIMVNFKMAYIDSILIVFSGQKPAPIHV